MSPLKLLLFLFLAFFAVVISVAVYVNSVVSDNLPSVDQLENPRQAFATQVLSADGELLDHFFEQRRVSLPFDSIPKDFINGLISVEDREFYEHWGVHTGRVFKALVKNVMAGRVKEGASTITMQLSRNLFYGQDKKLDRKIKEAFAAMQIERKYTKNEILTMYANTVAFGRGAYGINVASQVYFGKSPSDLTLAECAYLVGILKAPEHYNGLKNMDKAIGRRNLVLSMMEDQGYITYAEFADATQEEISLSSGKIKKNLGGMLAPHFVENIRQDLRRQKDDELQGYDLYRDGLIIYTTLNSKIQRYANEVVNEHLGTFQKKFDKEWRWSRNKKLLNTILNEAVKDRAEYIAADKNKKKSIKKRLLSDKGFVDSVKNAATTLQCGLVVLNPKTGAILAMVGASPKFMKENPDAKYSLNHATQIKRQPGSCFKPIVYASALQQGLTPESVIKCGPFEYTDPYTEEVWKPRGTGHCETEDDVRTLYQALAGSINTVAARLITEVTTPNQVKNLARRMGIRSSLQAVPSLALGSGGEVKPIEIISAFGTFPNEGIHVDSYYITSIEDQFGNIIQTKDKGIQASDVLSPDIARDMVFMMKGVVDYGTGRGVRKYFNGVDACGKTGTTNDYTDAWFIGYTPELVAGVWVGFDDNRVTFQSGIGYAASAAAPIFGKLMAKIYADEKLNYTQKKFKFLVADSLDAERKKEMIDGINVPVSQPDTIQQAENRERPVNDSNTKKFPKLKLEDTNAVKRKNN
jgi:penicillin-binding protein 1A